jgi:hypothetical protein
MRPFTADLFTIPVFKSGTEEFSILTAEQT